ncbi:hypothetical protein [Botrimarina mediterranea]|uniref:Uncharacterized protein n=1 Tax=Botrimarina mediterranea TaxID=2528022 RepID=A0A518K6X4_9BACT|nr:hypothetical protein [Botrimarina mediterranea]QDV73553.1 hypothetical protein Spa11_17510 [Botrimarina mediterranea]
MTLSRWRLILGALLAPLLAMPVLAADDYSNTPYYEEEPWYDITEWFDGDDYRRTDPSEWNDDETDYEYDYGYHYDVDGDLDYGGHYDEEYGYDSDYGYDDLYANDDWFYDYWYWNDGQSYYSDWDSDGMYEYVTKYRDYDNDGFYDAYLTYRDWDDDGIYEDIDYYSFNDVSAGDQSADSNDGRSMQAKARRTQGTVAKVKKVKVRGNEHLLVRLDGGEGKQSTVDLGPAKALKDHDIAEGTEIQANGPVVKAGEKRLLVAKSAKIDGETFKPNRNRAQVKGTIVSTRKFENRGDKHVLATVKTDRSDAKKGEKSKGGKMLVDLGPASKLDIDLAEDDRVTIEGAPAKVNDRPILIASRIQHDGESIAIDRRSDQRGDNSQQASSQQASSNQASSNQASRDRQQSSESQMTKANKSPSFSGKVASMRKATVRGQERQLMVLRSDAGRNVLVDLGPAEQGQQACEPGDECRVRGPVVKARGGQPIVLCRMLIIDNGERTRVRPQQPNTEDLREVTGDIRALTTVEVRGTERQHAHVNTQDGKKLIVDLGSPEELPMKLSKGDQISARGRIVKANNDQLILVAFEASKSGGQSQSIER